MSSGSSRLGYEEHEATLSVLQADRRINRAKECRIAPLNGDMPHRLIWGMAVTRTDMALAAGLTASAATLGVLIGLGRKAVDPFFALAAGGHLWMGSPVSTAWPYVLMGALRHVLLVTPLGVGLVLTPETRRHPGWVAVAVAGVAVLVAPSLPDLIRPLALDLAPAERVLTWLVLAGGLTLGARLTPERQG